MLLDFDPANPSVNQASLTLTKRQRENDRIDAEVQRYRTLRPPLRSEITTLERQINTQSFRANEFGIYAPIAEKELKVKLAEPRRKLKDAQAQLAEIDSVILALQAKKNKNISPEQLVELTNLSLIAGGKHRTVLELEKKVAKYESMKLSLSVAAAKVELDAARSERDKAVKKYQDTEKHILANPTSYWEPKGVRKAKVGVGLAEEELQRANNRLDTAKKAAGTN